MCYGMKCYFETSMGGCKVRSFDDFKETIGYGACLIGGLFEDEFTEKYWTENNDKLVELRELAYTKNLIMEW